MVRESSFIEKVTMWEFEPSDSAILKKDFPWEDVKDIMVSDIDVLWNKCNRYRKAKAAIDFERKRAWYLYFSWFRNGFAF